MATTILSKPSREYLDLDFSFAKHPITSNVAIKKGINSVRQSILHLLQLKSGDKPFHPEIKSPIYDYLFENASSIVQVVLESEIKKYLSVYEPRAIIEYVDISFPDPNSINCTVVGQIINIKEPFTVTFLVNRLR